MQASDLPSWSAKRFAQDAGGPYVRTVPQTTADPAAASMSLGFPPQTFTDEGAGGTPPDGRDFNGILNFLAAWAQWYGAGGPVPYTAAIASAGGYPKGAIVQSAVTDGLLWQSTADNNVTNPDAAGAGWVALSVRTASVADIQAAVSAQLVVTPKNLQDAGYDRVTAQNLVSNLGYRTYASGFKQCWGRVSVPANSNVTVTVPVVHTGFIDPTIGAEIKNVAGSSAKVGLLPVDLNNFTLVNWEAVSMNVNWQTVGV